jgi:predicted secreted Zn-dependent protease
MSITPARSSRYLVAALLLAALVMHPAMARASWLGTTSVGLCAQGASARDL